MFENQWGTRNRARDRLKKESYFMTSSDIGTGAPSVCPQRTDPRQKKPRRACHDGPHTTSWLLELDQESVQQVGLPWKLV